MNLGRSLVALVLLTGCGAKPPAPIDAPGHASPAVDATPPPVVRVDAPVAARPTPLAGLQDVTALAAGNDHACALVADGRILCWGANSSGELGDGTLVSRETPAAVDLQALDAP